MTEARSILFLSCDIVGSTRYKQQGNVWQQTFLSFYREFPQILGELTRDAEYEPGFSLWKPIGDELIFTSIVSSECDIYRAVRIWLQVMDSYERNVLSGVSLSTKGGAFIATFPGPDSESSIPRDPTSETSDKGVVELNDEALASRSNDYLFDFFGPSIDTGFRVISASSNRYFTLSIDVAWAMAAHSSDAGVDRSRTPLDDLKLLESREFKGVWAGREYPLFVLDRHHGDLVNRALAHIRDQELRVQDVVDLCRACSESHQWPSQLYLPGSSRPEFRVLPVDSLDALRSNSMDGAESVPVDQGGPDNLDDDAPLGVQ